MKHYIGLDVSMVQTSICVIDQQGNVLREAAVSTQPHDIAHFIQNLQGPIELVGLESGSLCHWLAEELLAKSLPVKCIDARHCAAFLGMRANKTDRNDARGIAEVMRCGIYREVHVKPREVRALSALLTSRRQLVRQRVQAMMSIRGLLKPLGLRLGSIPKSEGGLSKIMTAVSGLEPHVRLAVCSLVHAIRGIMESITELDRQIQRAPTE